ncbi:MULTISPECIES: hypothetical protein [unclassified Nocardioides]|uniref:hypothetical protein n=1 Tax=unclassified Nocardioides TaxID=2615069 RepID=UPI00301526F5
MRRPSLRSAAPVLLLTVALIATAGGGAVAGTLITGRQIKDDTVTTKDIKNRSLRTKDLSTATVAGLRGGAGAAGAPGLVRGYGWVNGTAVNRQSGGITATQSATGVTCVRVPGVSSLTSVAVVTLDFTLDSTSPGVQTYAEVSSNPSGCPSSSDFRVVTWSRDANTGVRTYGFEPFYLLAP